MRAMQFLPGNRSIVHHALTGYIPRESGQEAVADWGGRAVMSHPDDQAGAGSTRMAWASGRHPSETTAFREPVSSAAMCPGCGRA